MVNVTAYLFRALSYVITTKVPVQAAENQREVVCSSGSIVLTPAVLRPHARFIFAVSNNSYPPSANCYNATSFVDPEGWAVWLSGEPPQDCTGLSDCRSDALTITKLRLTDCAVHSTPCAITRQCPDGRKATLLIDIYRYNLSYRPNSRWWLRQLYADDLKLYSVFNTTVDEWECDLQKRLRPHDLYKNGQICGSW